MMTANGTWEIGILSPPDSEIKLTRPFSIEIAARDRARIGDQIVATRARTAQLAGNRSI
jgi:hypothetical protein